MRFVNVQNPNNVLKYVHKPQLSTHSNTIGTTSDCINHNDATTMNWEYILSNNGYYFTICCRIGNMHTYLVKLTNNNCSILIGTKLAVDDYLANGIWFNVPDEAIELDLTGDALMTWMIDNYVLTVRDMTTGEVHDYKMQHCDID